MGVKYFFELREPTLLYYACYGAFDFVKAFDGG